MKKIFSYLLAFPVLEGLVGILASMPFGFMSNTYGQPYITYSIISLVLGVSITLLLRNKLGK